MVKTTKRHKILLLVIMAINAVILVLLLVDFLLLDNKLSYITDYAMFISFISIVLCFIIDWLNKRHYKKKNNEMY